MKHCRFLLLVVMAALLWSCVGRRGQKAAALAEAASLDSATTISPRYAKGFSVRYLENGVKLLDVADPQQDEDRMPVSYRFALVPRGTKAQVPEGYTAVEVPIGRAICMTMLQLSNFTALGAHDRVCGITGTKNLFDADMLQRVKEGKVVKIGMEGNFDAELIFAAQPDVIFISPFKRGGYEAIKETGIMLVPHLGYKETSPLGQAEWVKFVALFTGQEQLANQVFHGIEQRYNTLRAQVDSLHERRPTVFSGEMHGGNWFAVGGQNHLAQIFRDAGADYVLDNQDTGGTNIEFEQMYALAAEADYWRVLNSFPGDFSYQALEASEPRNALFRAFREHHVIYCNMKQTPYYELTPVEPDVVLSDLVAIFHPELVGEDYKPKYYRLLP